MSTFGLAEGFASWQWVNYLISKVPTGKKPLLINMDETAVCLFRLFAQAEMSPWFQGQKEATVAAATAPAGESTNCLGLSIV